MDSKSSAPETLVEAIRYFADPDVCVAFVASLRWPNGVWCPRCGEHEVSLLSTRRIWKCKGCKRQFSVKVGTIFEDSPLGLNKWLLALWLVVNCKNGISSYETARALGVTQKTGWFMLHRIRLAMQTDAFTKLGGEVEVDETFICGRARFMKKGKREQNIKGTSLMGKVAGMGLVHGVIDHAEAYAKGRSTPTAWRTSGPAEAPHQGYLRERRAVPPVPLPR